MTDVCFFHERCSQLLLALLLSAGLPGSASPPAYCGHDGAPWSCDGRRLAAASLDGRRRRRLRSRARADPDAHELDGSVDASLPPPPCGVRGRLSWCRSGGSDMVRGGLPSRSAVTTCAPVQRALFKPNVARKA